MNTRMADFFEQLKWDGVLPVEVANKANGRRNLHKERLVRNHFLHDLVDHYKRLLQDPNKGARLPRLRLEGPFQDRQKLIVNIRHQEIKNGPKTLSRTDHSSFFHKD
jgi:hypothetical protein